MPTKRTLVTAMPVRALPSPTRMYKKRRTTTYKKGYQRTSGFYGRYAPTGTELKFLDTSWNDTTVAATGEVILPSVNLIPQGVTESQRIGRKCIIRSISLRYVIQIKPTTNTNNTDDGVRLILFQDKQCNGTAATVTDLLKTADYLSFNNLSNKERFKVLADKFVDVHSTAGGGSTATFGELGVTKSLYIKCYIPIEFSSTTGAITEIRSNNIGVLLISDSADTACEGLVRVRFSDN